MSNTELPPLPEPALTHDRHGGMLLIGPCYTADQMRAYARAALAQPAASGEPVAEVGDLIIQARERVMAGGAKNRDPLYTAQPAPAPPGWVMVPVEPTPQMLQASLIPLKEAARYYTRMLAAAPGAPDAQKGAA